MSSKARHIVAVFFLAAFLAPAIVNESHTFFHGEEFHCQAVGETHIHIQHHDCVFCDFVIPAVFVPSSFQSFFSAISFSRYIFPIEAEHFYSFSQFSNAQLRAPPAVS